jgi:hypothetical protein
MAAPDRFGGLPQYRRDRPDHARTSQFPESLPAHPSPHMVNQIVLQQKA